MITSATRRWGSLRARSHGDDPTRALLTPWPEGLPANWVDRVNAPLTVKELDRMRVSLKRGRPYGDDDWVDRQARALGLEHTVRPEGRPPRVNKPGSTPPETLIN